VCNEHPRGQAPTARQRHRSRAADGPVCIGLKKKVKMNICSIWPFAQISDDFTILIFGNVPDILLQRYSRS